MSWNKLNSRPDSASRAARMGDWGEGVIFNGVVRGGLSRWCSLRKDQRCSKQGPGSGVCLGFPGTEGDQCGWSRVREDDTEARPSQVLGAIVGTWWFSWRETEGLKQRMPWAGLCVEKHLKRARRESGGPLKRPPLHPGKRTAAWIRAGKQKRWELDLFEDGISRISWSNS